MLQILKKLRVLLDRKQKTSMVGLVILMIIGGALQTVGVTMLVAVVSIVFDPKALAQSSIAQTFYQMLGDGVKEHFNIIVMLVLIAVYIIKNIFLYFQEKCTLSFVYVNQFRTSERMMRNYLRRGYEYFLNADTAVVQRSITSDVNNMYALILAILQFLSDIIVFVFLIVFLFLQDPVMTVLVAGVLIVLLLIIKNILKPIMHKAGEDNQHYYSGLFKWISQTVQGIKEDRKSVV